MGHLKNTRYINIPVYNVSMEDDILNLDTSIGITLVFPNIQDSGCMYADKRWYVNDATGGAAANPVTITAVSGIQINDATSQQLSTANFGACVFATNREKYIVTGSGSGGGGTTIVTSPFTPSNTSIVVGDDFQEVAEKSQGQINDIVTNVTTLQNNEYKITYFAEINTATGTITKPAGSTILLDQFAGGVDAYVSTITNGQPTGDFPETAGGVLVDVASFDASGNFVLSGTPSDYPCALIYIIKISAVDLSNALISNRLDLEDINIVKATQSTVDAGTNDNQFVTPYTFTNAAKWALYQLALTAANFGSFINGLTSKSTPVDADYIPLMDSADSNNTKKLSWANLKTTLAVLFGRPVIEYYSDTSAVSPPDGSIYYWSSVNNNAPSGGATWFISSPANDTKWSFQVNALVATTLGSAENTTIDLLNITAGTTETLGTLKHNKRINTSGYIVSTLANTVNDDMILRITNPAFGTNPTNVYYQFFAKQY